MALLLSNGSYTIISGADDVIFLRTKSRHIQFKSIQSLYEMSTCVIDNIEWRMKTFPRLWKEQEEDGLIQAFKDFIVWYNTRKFRAKIHVRMVGKLLHWHKQSVEKLWNPSNPNNTKRIMEMINDP